MNENMVRPAVPAGVGAVKQVDGKSEAYYSLNSITDQLSSQKRRLYSIISNIDL